jgi:hypothetical protein
MRIHPKVIADKFSKGIFVETWKNLSTDYISCRYSFDLEIGEERFKKCVGHSGGPISFDWWDSDSNPFKILGFDEFKSNFASK